MQQHVLLTSYVSMNNTHTHTHTHTYIYIYIYIYISVCVCVSRILTGGVTGVAGEVIVISPPLIFRFNRSSTMSLSLPLTTSRWNWSASAACPARLASSAGVLPSWSRHDMAAWAESGKSIRRSESVVKPRLAARWSSVSETEKSSPRCSFELPTEWCDDRRVRSNSVSACYPAATAVRNHTHNTHRPTAANTLVDWFTHAIWTRTHRQLTPNSKILYRLRKCSKCSLSLSV